MPDRVEPRSNLGAVLAGLGRYEEAIEQYRQALRIAPQQIEPQLRLNIALAYYKSSQIADAIPELEIVQRSRASDRRVILLLADCYFRTGKSQDVIHLLETFDSSEPGMEAVDYLLGMALLRTGRIDEGQQHLDRILRKGESAEGHFLLGSALFAAHNYPAAVKEFSKAAAMNPDLPSLQSYYGRALLFTGDADGAAAAFRRELASNPNDYDANFQLASILSQRGQADEARPLLERAVRVNPGSLEARDALANGFDFEAPAASRGGVGVGSTAPPVGALDLKQRSKPVLLVFGSYTCPQLRAAAGALKRLHAEYGDRVDFHLIYIREAHADGGPEAQWQSSINQREGIALTPARDLGEKQAHADLCVRKLGFPFSTIVDPMDARAETAYDAWPSRVYLVDRSGRVAFNSRLGDLDFRPERLASAIREILAKGVRNASSR